VERSFSRFFATVFDEIAKLTKFFQHGGKVTGKRIVADNDTRLRALDMALRLRGSFAAANPKLTEAMGVKVIILDVPRPKRTVPIATSPQLPSLRDRFPILSATTNVTPSGNKSALESRDLRFSHS
jgi:hypothetical protein